MDEGTSALDNKTEELVMNSISELGKEITIILIAHVGNLPLYKV